jgi:ferredoxin
VTPHPGGELLRVAEAVHAGEVSVSFRPGPTVLAKVGEKVLDIAEASQVPIDSGCRMGMCGSDPVHILEGEETFRRCARLSGEPASVCSSGRSDALS